MPEESALQLVVVGESPGGKECVERRPFVGPTGAILTDELAAVGLSRSNIHVTNATLCQPHSDKDAERAAECCAPRLLRELAGLDPATPILTMGKAATRSVLGVKSILLARGFVWTTRDLSLSVKAAEAAVRKAQREHRGVGEASLRLATIVERHALRGRVVLPTLHPTFAFIHNELWAPVFRVDLDRAARWVRGELCKEGLDDRVTRVDTVAGLVEGTFLVTDSVRDIQAVGRLLGDTIGCDIETTRVTPVSPLLTKTLTVQVSDGVRSMVIAPWDARRHAKPLTALLKGRTVVFHNGFNFDHPALERDGVSLADCVLEDTLVAHHSFASHFPQKLDHVVATFLDSSPWKVRFGVRGLEEKGQTLAHRDDDDLYTYGATDALLTIKAWRRIQADLEPERAVYEHDKELGRQGKGMQVVGIRVDRRRKRLLSKKLRARALALKGRMRVVAGRPLFAPSKLGEVRKVLFGVLKAPMLNPTATGLASTSNATLETIRTGGIAGHDETRGVKAARFAEALLKWRVAVKIRSTYVEAVTVHRDGRAHYTWRPYGTVSGRYDCRLQSCPRWSTAIEDRPREMYTASAGGRLVYFDLSQAEMRAAAFLSGDAAFQNTCRGDVHTGNALVLFPDAFEALQDPKGAGKPYRDIAKNAGFAVSYLAEVPTVFAYLRAHGFPVSLDDVETMLDRLKSTYRRYYEYVADNVAFAEREGYLRTALTGRIRRFGFHPKPTDISNFPIQSLVADVMNTRTLGLQGRLPPGARLVAQIHDACLIDVPLRHVERVEGLIKETWSDPVRVAPSQVCPGGAEFLLPAEIKVGRRWSAF
jgi:uracil-DNA glycosylase family 4